MPKEIIRTNKAPEPIGPYNQAVKADNFIYTSGQIPIVVETGAICNEGVAEQTNLVLGHIKAILESVGASMEDVIKTTVYLKNMDDFIQMNEVYACFFDSDQAPVRSTVEVSKLPKDVLVEIDAVAMI